MEKRKHRHKQNKEKGIFEIGYYEKIISYLNNEVI